MTREEAYTHLELPEGADMQEVRRKFAALHSDYRMRIDNAPTPRLRQLFGQQLEQIKKAYSLLNGSNGMNDTIDLPRTKRVMDETPEAAWESDMDISNPVITGWQEEQNRRTERAYPQPIKKSTRSFPALKNPKERTTIAIIERVISCILAVIIGYYFMFRTFRRFLPSSGHHAVQGSLIFSVILIIVTVVLHIYLSRKTLRIIWAVIAGLFILLIFFSIFIRILSQ